MKLGSFLVLAAIVAGFFGLALLVVPAQLVDLYGVKLTPATEVIGRTAGATNLGFAVLFWSIRNASGAEVKPAMLAGLIASGLICLDHAACHRRRACQCARLGAGRDQRPAGVRLRLFLSALNGLKAPRAGIN